ncbi:tetratricopeptide repeat protein [Gaoshiqia sp. Z1-71]|uniref:tetratricopeptide repeat protein n=1 Tax=Gaoshiqia hydrogeniformans TaxID=3290090 RepID=UPI003BF7DB97
MFRKLILPVLVFAFFSGFSQNIDQLMLNRDYEQALQQLDEELAKNPSAALYFKKGVVCEKLMDFETAVSSLKLACRVDSAEAVYREELGEACLGMGNSTDAAACFREALNLKPGSLRLKGKLAQAYINLKAWNDAYVCYQEIHETDSINPYFNRYFAYTAYRTNRMKQAVDLYETLAAQQNRDLNVYLNLAAIYNKAENKEAAVTACARGLLIFPGHPALLVKQAETYFQHKDYAAALPFYAEYIAMNDSSRSVLKNYGICLYFSQQEEDALHVLGKCYQETVNDPIVNFYMGAAYKKLKQFPESVGFFKLAIETATPFYLAEIYHHLGQVYGWQREYQLSIEAYREAMRLDPEKLELLFEIATTYEEFDFQKTIALHYYRDYLKQAGEQARNAAYALDRIKKIKEELFFEE